MWTRTVLYFKSLVMVLPQSSGIRQPSLRRGIGIMWLSVFNASAQTLDIYLNGNDNGTLLNTIPAATFNSGRTLWWVKYADNIFWNGLMDSIKIYNYPRTQKQIIRIWMLGILHRVLQLGHQDLAGGGLMRSMGLQLNNSSSKESPCGNALTNIASPATSTLAERTNSR